MIGDSNIRIHKVRTVAVLSSSSRPMYIQFRFFVLKVIIINIEIGSKWSGGLNIAYTNPHDMFRYVTQYKAIRN